MGKDFENSGPKFMWGKHICFRLEVMFSSFVSGTQDYIQIQTSQFFFSKGLQVQCIEMTIMLHSFPFQLIVFLSSILLWSMLRFLVNLSYSNNNYAQCDWLENYCRWEYIKSWCDSKPLFPPFLHWLLSYYFIKEIWNAFPFYITWSKHLGSWENTPLHVVVSLRYSCSHNFPCV